ncbi:hypothetical protein J155_00656 [Xanthomonas citri pv. citri]|nr:hypothetical protein XAC29_02730 [Xanthomonas axonopodis Xac29-1]AJD67127.1 hypothetical protein J151_00658 [Xanthomonas citri subsp. citri A306]AJY80661.1 hypothetical protein J159_00655 [Xanthomonas citri pv. citri]AJY85083.1 hypothetical protein J158_00655 [Xanthomonas citri subsp. citri UI6]QYF43334.1 hypothetical protein HZS93_00587 [Xanthomonas citri]
MCANLIRLRACRFYLLHPRHLGRQGMALRHRTQGLQLRDSSLVPQAPSPLLPLGIVHASRLDQQADAHEVGALEILGHSGETHRAALDAPLSRRPAPDRLSACNGAS